MGVVIESSIIETVALSIYKLSLIIDTFSTLGVRVRTNLTGQGLAITTSAQTIHYQRKGTVAFTIVNIGQRMFTNYTRT